MKREDTKEERGISEWTIMLAYANVMGDPRRRKFLNDFFGENVLPRSFSVSSYPPLPDPEEILPMDLIDWPCPEKYE